MGHFGRDGDAVGRPRNMCCSPAFKAQNRQRRLKHAARHYFIRNTLLRPSVLIHLLLCACKILKLFLETCKHICFNLKNMYNLVK